MFNLSKYLRFEYENEYEKEYDLKPLKKYSTPKIYTAKGDLTKRWYVYYSFRNPATGYLERQKPYYGNINSCKEKEGRLEIAIICRKMLLQLLKDGFNPFEENSYLNNENRASTQDEVCVVKKSIKIDEALKYALDIKESNISESTKRAYKNRVELFRKWLKKEGLLNAEIEKLDKSVVTSFLNSIVSKSSATNRNNYRADLSSLFQVLVDNDIIEINVISKIPKLKANPVRNKTYTNDILEEIQLKLTKTDPVLMLFIQFISYNFLRPIEVCRLKVGDLNINERTLQFKAKNSTLKTKIIPEILIDKLPDLSEEDPNHFLFTPEGFCKPWGLGEDARRDYFSKRFYKKIKKPLGLGNEYGLYSFRHTYITKLYREFRKTLTPFEAKSKLILITGHSTMTALDKYLRDIDAELPEDYSASFK